MTVERANLDLEASQAEKILAATLDCIGQGVLVVGKDRRILVHNKLFNELLDVPIELSKPGTPVEALVRWMVERGGYGSGSIEEHVTSRLNSLESGADVRYRRTILNGNTLEIVRREVPGLGHIATYTAISSDSHLYKPVVNSDEYLNEIVTSIPLAVFAVDCDHRVTHWNGACELLTDISAEQVLGTTDSWRAFYETQRPVMADLVVDDASHKDADALYDGKCRPSDLIEGAFEAMDFFPNMGGRDRWLYGAAAPMRGRQGELLGAVEILLDVTELQDRASALSNSYREMAQCVEDRTRELQETNQQLEQTLGELQSEQTFMVQSEKMASIGQLAAGVAHEINNPTGFVASNLNSLSDYMTDITGLLEGYRRLVSEVAKTTPEGAVAEVLSRVKETEKSVDLEFLLEDLESLVAESREGTERIKKIVQALKDFAHPGQGTMEFANVNELIESTLSVVNNEIKYKATVEKSLESLPLVKCLAQELNQVFVNLLVNAAQAIEGMGVIRIATRSLDEQWIEISISDTGTGIPEEQIKKVFDPFFTTKEVGQGTGLGLNVVYSIVAKHKGTVEVESEVGKGTLFTIRLPVEPELVSEPATDS